MLSTMLSFGVLLHDFSVKGGKVVWCAARHQPLIGDYLGIFPKSFCIDQILFYCSHGGEFPTFYDFRINQYLRSVTNGRHRFTRCEEFAYERKCSFIRPQFVRITRPAWNRKGVVVVILCIAEWCMYRVIIRRLVTLFRTHALLNR